MGRKRIKPEYDPDRVMSEQLAAISEAYLGQETGDNESLRKIAKDFDITHLKARKLLITAGVYHTEMSDRINELKSQGKTIAEIQELTGLGRASVHSYLPYTKIIYNSDEKSPNAERVRKHRKKHITE